LDSDLNQSIVGMINELANWFLFTFLLFIGILALYTIWHMRTRKMREYRRQKYSASNLGDKLDITSVLPNLSKDEMRNIAHNEKAKKEEETINLDDYHGLPLKPKVYFDPKRDTVVDGPQPEPKIKRSFLSNEPLPKPEQREKRSVEEIYKANEIPWDAMVGTREEGAADDLPVQDEPAAEVELNQSVDKPPDPN